MTAIRDHLWKAVLVGWMIVAAGLLLNYRPFTSPSGSMVPTLWIGDYFLVSKMSYGLSKYSIPFHPDAFSGRIFASQPARGDVVVFALPRDPATFFVKRVVGLPGDQIQMRGGRLYINGAMVAREPVAKVRAEGFDGRVTDVPTYQEILPNGVTYTIIEIQGDTGFNDNTELFKVPPDDYFVMGDNRDNSTDSRIPPEQGGVGFVPFENLIGRAEILVYTKGNGAADVPFTRIH